MYDCRKATKPLGPDCGLTFSSPNREELLAMLTVLPSEECDLLPNGESLPELAAAAARLMDHCGLACLLVTLGQDGVLLVRKGGPGWEEGWQVSQYSHLQPFS